MLLCYLSIHDMLQCNSLSVGFRYASVYLSFHSIPRCTRYASASMVYFGIHGMLQYPRYTSVSTVCFGIPRHPRCTLVSTVVLVNHHMHHGHCNGTSQMIRSLLTDHDGRQGQGVRIMWTIMQKIQVCEHQSCDGGSGT